MTNSLDTATATETLRPGFVDQFRELAKRPKLSRKREWLIPFACCVALCLQLYLSIGRLSQTADEATHLYSGYRILACRDYSFSPEHPPLGKMAAAVPLLLSRVPVDCSKPKHAEAYESLDWLYSFPNWESLLRWARISASVFAIGLVLLIWSVARRVFGFTAACVATVLYVFEPNVLAHGALVTTDTVVTFWLFASVAAFYGWTVKRTLPRLAGAGIVVGLTLAAKHSGVMIFPILIALAALNPVIGQEPWRIRLRTAVRDVAAVAAIALVATFTLWMVYGFRHSARPDGVALHEIQRERGDGSFIFSAARNSRIFPEAYLEGFHRARLLARGRSALMLLGKPYDGAPWYFFPVVVAIKATLGTIVLALASLFVVPDLWRENRKRLLFVLLPLAIFMAACMNARMSSGIRHTLPLVPFAMVFLGAAAFSIWKRPRVRWLVVVAAVLHIGSSLHAYPNYLSYANEAAGGPTRLHRRLPNTDWGQSYWELKDYLARNHPGEPCWLASIYLMDIRKYGVPCKQFWSRNFEPIPKRVRGVLVLSSAIVSGGAVDWSPVSRNVRPEAQIGGSAMMVYSGEFDTAQAAGASSAFAALLALGHGEFQSALRHATTAVETMPDDSTVRSQYCLALTANNYVAEARLQCSLARVLLLEGRLSADEERAVIRSLAAREFLRNGDREAALANAQQAVLASPDSVTARLTFCNVLQAADDRINTTSVCRSAMNIMRARWGRNFPPGEALSRRNQLEVVLRALGVE